ncbi:unnamed protein product [Musa acuminata subsp. malaccensis]|uniref:(wild Malaysian banana) hypothetical protein n=1 Tax=Musa acuminata subsp. malaccensis TaxID=214687 RepID=A0A804HTE9_MUSAM|nr:unnamed protein product [Musa acuminata subsp. malaccensis]
MLLLLVRRRVCTRANYRESDLEEDSLKYLCVAFMCNNE